MNNRFDQENHIFYMDEERVPSITQAMPEPVFYVTKERLEELRKMGNEDHELIKMYFDTGKIFNEPMLFALDIWYNANKDKLGKLVWHEKPLYSKQHRFAGIPDAIFEHAIVDFKRSFSNKYTHSLQTGAQHILAVENKIIEPTASWFIVYYNNGKMSAKCTYDDKAESAFLKCVDKWYIDQQIKNYLKGESHE
jgi:hypothetical protein